MFIFLCVFSLKLLYWKRGLFSFKQNVFISVTSYFISLTDVYRMAKRFRGLEILKTIVLKRIRTDINQTITGKVQYKQRQERVTNNHEFKQMINAWKTDRLTARNRSCQRQSILSFHCRCGVFLFVTRVQWTWI